MSDKAQLTELRRAFKFRLYPTLTQERTLLRWESQLRWLWNLAHEQRLMAMARPKGERPRVNVFSQCKEMTSMKEVDARLAEVLCSARQQVMRDLDTAWQRFFKKLGGRPRFKRRTDTMRFHASTAAHWRIVGERLELRGIASKLGAVRMVQDRAFPEGAKLSQCNIVRDVDQWFAVFLLAEDVDVPDTTALPVVGINRGAVNGVVDSNGDVREAPAYFEKSLSRVQVLSRRLARKETGSKNREKARLKLARAHRKIRRQREWWQHQVSLHYASTSSAVAVEAFDTKRMTSSEPDERVTMRKADLNRKILDVGWYEIARQIRYKCERRGSRVIDVNPAFVSRTCSQCGCGAVTSSSGRKIFDCDACGLSLLGDVNAARNILSRALSDAPPEKKARVSLKIKGRQRKTSTGESPQSAGSLPAEEPR